MAQRFGVATNYRLQTACIQQRILLLIDSHRHGFRYERAADVFVRGNPGKESGLRSERRSEYQSAFEIAARSAVNIEVRAVVSSLTAAPRDVIANHQPRPKRGRTAERKMFSNSACSSHSPTRRLRTQLRGRVVHDALLYSCENGLRCRRALRPVMGQSLPSGAEGLRAATGTPVGHNAPCTFCSSTASSKLIQIKNAQK
jgi:hypothetical protein